MPSEAAGASPAAQLPAGGRARALTGPSPHARRRSSGGTTAAAGHAVAYAAEPGADGPAVSSPRAEGATSRVAEMRAQLEAEQAELARKRKERARRQAERAARYEQSSDGGSCTASPARDSPVGGRGHAHSVSAGSPRGSGGVARGVTFDEPQQAHPSDVAPVTTRSHPAMRASID